MLYQLSSLPVTLTGLSVPEIPLGETSPTKLVNKVVVDEATLKSEAAALFR